MPWRQDLSRRFWNPLSDPRVTLLRLLLLAVLAAATWAHAVWAMVPAALAVMAAPLMVPVAARPHPLILALAVGEADWLERTARPARMLVTSAGALLWALPFYALWTGHAAAAAALAAAAVVHRLLFVVQCIRLGRRAAGRQ